MQNSERYKVSSVLGNLILAGVIAVAFPIIPLPILIGFGCLGLILVNWGSLRAVMSFSKTPAQSLTFVHRNQDPWFQVQINHHDYHETILTPGTLYTYRVSLENSSRCIFRKVCVKLVSISPKPPGFNSIGGNLHFRHEASNVVTMDISPTLTPDGSDALFVDVLCYFLGQNNHEWLEACTTVPGQSSARKLKMENCTLTLKAFSESGDIAVAELALIIRPQRFPLLQLVKSETIR